MWLFFCIYFSTLTDILCGGHYAGRLVLHPFVVCSIVERVCMHYNDALLSVCSSNYWPVYTIPTPPSPPSPRLRGVLTTSVFTGKSPRYPSPEITRFFTPGGGIPLVYPPLPPPFYPLFPEHSLFCTVIVG